MIDISAADLQWIYSGFTLGYGSCVLIAGKLADIVSWFLSLFLSFLFEEASEFLYIKNLTDLDALMNLFAYTQTVWSQTIPAHRFCLLLCILTWFCLGTNLLSNCNLQSDSRYLCCFHHSILTCYLSSYLSCGIKDENRSLCNLFHWFSSWFCYRIIGRRSSHRTYWSWMESGEWWWSTLSLIDSLCLI